MSARVIATSGSTLGTAGTGGEVRGPGGRPFYPPCAHLRVTGPVANSRQLRTLDLEMNLEMGSRGR